MKQVKINQVESYKDSQVDTIVCKGKLVFIQVEEPKDSLLFIPSSLPDKVWTTEGCGIRTMGTYYKPIIISETERPSYGTGIELDCKVYDSHYKRIVKEDVGTSGYKILALPENFSPRQLQTIVDSKLKDGDEVYVECEEDLDELEKLPHDEDLRDFYKVKLFLPMPGHIKLFPVKQSVEDAIQNYEGLADAYQDYVELHWEEYNKEIVKAIKYGIELAKKNNT
jgi:hypothetical protein